MSLLDDLRAGEADQTELQDLLLDHFGSSRQTGEREVEFNRGDEPTLLLTYGSRGDLQRVDARPALSEEDIATLRKRVAEQLLQPGDMAVAQRAAFTYQPLQGFIRYGDDFQVVPPPAAAPVSPQPVGEHPCLLEVSFRRSGNLGTDLIRAEKRLREVALTLGVLVPPFLTVQLSTGRSDWVYGDIVNGQITSEYRQLGYAYPGQGGSGEFTDVTGIAPAPSKNANEYYGRVGIVAGEELYISDTFYRSLDQLRDLAEEKRAKFLRSSYWFCTSHRVHPASMSSAFTALVSAIEALVPATPSPPCPECNRPTGPGPTALFRELVERYVPGIPQKARSELYVIRSKLTHGDRLLLGDELGWGINHQRSTEGMKYGLLRDVARLVLLNWLEDPT